MRSLPKGAEQHVRQAIEWMVVLRSGEASPEEFIAFEHWRNADPRHDAVFRQIEDAAGALAPLRGAGNADSVHRTLIAPVSRRHLLGTALAVIGAGLGGAMLAHQQTDLLADVRTGTGQRRRLVLADGSALQLDARSAADVTMTGPVREVRLRSGQVLVTAARDAAARPFLLNTPFGKITAPAARFMVRLLAAGAQVDVLESAVLVEAGGRALRVDAGTSAWLDRHGATPRAGNPAAAAWVDGLLEVNNQPLSQVVEALRQYHHGVIVLAPEAAALRVSGVYQLDDVETALDSLQKTLPLRITRITRYWVSIDAA